MTKPDIRSHTKQGTPRRHLHKHDREELVYHFAVMYGTASPSEIQQLIKRETGHMPSRPTIHKDLQKLNNNVELWTHGQARSQWMARIQKMYIDTNQQITNIQDTIRKLIASDPKIPESLYNALAAIPNAKDQKEAARVVEKLMATADATRYGGKMAFMIKTMIEAQAHLVEVMTGMPLYHKLQEYAKQNEPYTKPYTGIKQ